MVPRTLSAALIAASLVLLGAPRARADDLPSVPDACTVHKKCSSTGIACEATDTACMSAATGKNLEVLCESTSGKRLVLVYCPSSTGRADSKVIWILMAAATLLAVGGATVAFAALKKKA